MPKTATAEPTVKRVVVYIIKGRLKGMRKIVGHMAVDPEMPWPVQINDCDLNKDGDGPPHMANVMLVKNHPKYVLYRECP